MGRPPSNGSPAFRFNANEVAEMEAILQAHHATMPMREVLVGLAEKFSASAERSGKIVVQMKQVWNWFQNRRYAIRAKAAKVPGKFSVLPVSQDNSTTVKSVPQAPHPILAPSVKNVPLAPQPLPVSSVQSAGKNAADNSQMEFEAKSARDGAWYDVSTFLSHRSLETGDPEVLVRFSGFGPEEDEWINVRRHVRQRSLPCESSECVAVLPGDLVLCFQEGKEQALYFDAHVLDAQRRRHDVRGCRCRFLVRYDHDQSEEIVPLRKVCRRPETDYRLQQLHAIKDSVTVNQQKFSSSPYTGNTIRASSPAETVQKQQKTEERSDSALVMPLAPLADVPQTPDVKLAQSRTPEAVKPEHTGNVNVPPSNVLQPKADETVNTCNAGDEHYSQINVAAMAEDQVLQSNVADTDDSATKGSPNVPPNSVAAMAENKVLQSDVAETDDSATKGSPNVPAINVVGATEDSATEEHINVPPTNVVGATDDSATEEVINVPPIDVIGAAESAPPQSNAAETSDSCYTGTVIVPPNEADTSGHINTPMSVDDVTGNVDGQAGSVCVVIDIATNAAADDGCPGENMPES